MTFEDTLARVHERLWVEGLDVVEELDVKAALEKRLGVKQDPYTIVWTWNPALADAALAHDPRAGHLLPWRVVVRRNGSGVVVSAPDPLLAIRLVACEDIRPFALSMRERLERAFASL